MSKEITKIFNKLADKELQSIRISELKAHAKKTPTKTSRPLISANKRPS